MTGRVFFRDRRFFPQPLYRHFSRLVRASDFSTKTWKTVVCGDVENQIKLRILAIRFSTFALNRQARSMFFSTFFVENFLSDSTGIYGIL